MVEFSLFNIKEILLLNKANQADLIINLGHLPTPPSIGEMEFQTPMLPLRSLCPIASSR